MKFHDWLWRIKGCPVRGGGGLMGGGGYSTFLASSWNIYEGFSPNLTDSKIMVIIMILICSNEPPPTSPTAEGGGMRGVEASTSLKLWNLIFFCQTDKDRAKLVLWRHSVNEWNFMFGYGADQGVSRSRGWGQREEFSTFSASSWKIYDRFSPKLADCLFTVICT